MSPPVLVDSNIAGCNIVRYRGRFYALPYTLGPVQLETWGAADLAQLVSDTELSVLSNNLQAAAKTGDAPQPKDATSGTADIT